MDFFFILDLFIMILIIKIFLYFNYLLGKYILK